jgi:hypothetical protein
MNIGRLFRGVVATVILLSLFGLTTRAQTVTPPAVEPVLGKAADNKVYAQQLINQLLSANADLLAVGLHAIPPGGKEYVIVAHSRDLIGKRDSDLDVDMIVNEKTIIALETSGFTTAPRMVVHDTLRDRLGRNIGLAVFSFRVEAKTGKLAAHIRAEELLKQLSSQIPDSAALFQPAS